jgi:phytoene dehydrogenase-like protein
MLAYLEHGYGIWHVEGGLSRISEAMADIFVKK